MATARGNSMRRNALLSMSLLLMGATLTLGPAFMPLERGPSDAYRPSPAVRMAASGAALAAPAAPADAAPAGAAPANAEAAQKAFAVLQTYCASCHGNGKRSNRQ